MIFDFRFSISDFRLNLRLAVALLLFILHPSSLIPAAAQETPLPKKSGVKLQFLPPPMEGTVSLGIYDTRGKLVRTLHREAEKDVFTKAFDGLVTTWDGKDDAGNDAPAGKYRARGFVVGEIKIDGEAFLFNDWIDGEESPRIRRITGIAPGEVNQLRLKGVAADGSALSLVFDSKNDGIKTDAPRAQGTPEPAFGTSADITATDGAKYAASLEEIRQSQTVRAAGLFEKAIWFSDELAQVKDKLEIAKGKPFVAAEKIPLTLRANPLNHDKSGSVEIAAGFDAKGSFLKTADGLVLRAISETKKLKWIAIGRGADGKSLAIFQSDGAVVEQFKAGGLRDMMAFDCGEFDFDPAKMKP